jgi:hypothetical protein
MAAFTKGQSGNPKGREPGSQNRVTRSFKEAMLSTFDGLGGATHLLAWAKKNPGDFYRIFARLTPPGFPVRLEALGDTPAQQARAVVWKLAAGEITPEQATTIMQTVSAQVKVVEADELERRLRALEERTYGINREPGNQT